MRKMKTGARYPDHRNPLQRTSLLSILMIFLLAFPAFGPGSGDTIHEAARKGDVERVREILDAHPERLEARDAAGLTALNWASRGVHEDLVRFLVERGADVNAREASGVMPLHSLIFRGERDLVELVVARGADVNARLAQGQTPLLFAVQGGFTGIADILLKNGADPEAGDLLGNTPLLLAASHGREDLVELFVSRGADVDAVNGRGTTPLDAALREGHEAVVKRLEEAGASPGPAGRAVLRGAYLGQDPPGLSPSLFAPGIVSTEQDQLNAVFTPGGDVFYFSVRRPVVGFTILEMRRPEGAWTRPRAAAFSGRYSDVDHFITSDGKRFFFCSNRPLEGDGPPREDHDIWFMTRKGEDWGPPRHLGLTVNSDRNDFYPTLTLDGTLYFSSHRDGGMGENDIYCSRIADGGYGPPANLGEAINTEFREFDPFVAPDESYLIFASSRPGGLGASDLHISFRSDDGTWTKAKNMGAPLNSAAPDLCPMLSPDGKYLFFTSRRAGVGDIYWVDAGVIGLMRK